MTPDPRDSLEYGLRILTVQPNDHGFPLGLTLAALGWFALGAVLLWPAFQECFKAALLLIGLKRRP